VSATDDRIKQALALAVRYGGIDGDHHKAWVIDQMVRVLTGCPQATFKARDAKGHEYEYEGLGKSEEYKQLVADACAGDDGPDTYSWDEGVPP
jgi:hypothetical protein